MQSSILLVSLLLSVAPFASIEAVKYTYCVDDPHCFSVLKGYETCNYYSSTPFLCFADSLNRIQIYCVFTQFTSNPSPSIRSFLTTAYIQFTNGKSKESYTAKDAAQPLTDIFDSKASIVNDPIDGKMTWLTITKAPIDGEAGSSYAIIIQDHQTQTTITFHKHNKISFSYYNIYVALDDNVANSGSGLLKDGCPAGYVASTIGRRKRLTDHSCENASGSNDPSMDDTIAKNICYNDIKYVPEIVDVIAGTVSAMNTHKIYHENTFPSKK